MCIRVCAYLRKDGNLDTMFYSNLDTTFYSNVDTTFHSVFLFFVFFPWHSALNFPHLITF